MENSKTRQDEMEAVEDALRRNAPTHGVLDVCAAVPSKPKRQLITNRSPWGDDVRAEALVLFNLGYSMRAAERAIKDKYGTSPAFTTLWGWRKDADMMGLIREQSEALSARA